VRNRPAVNIGKDIVVTAGQVTAITLPNTCK
jgi:hypothetical protein